MKETVITAQALTKKFGEFTAVNAVSFEVTRGEILGYLGPNGSGKTTTMRILLGLLRPTSGQASVFGFDVARDSENIRPLVGYMSQKFALYEELTVRENLEFYGGVYSLRGQNLRQRVEAVIAQVGLSGHEQGRAGQLSSGWRQRLALGIALIHQPKLLFLDEPTSGVDPEARREFWDVIYTLAEQGTTIFVSTHYMDEAEYCGRLAIMNQGRLLALDTPSNLKQNIVQGEAWNIIAAPLIPALDALVKLPGVQQAGLLGDHLHAITTRGTHSAESLSTALHNFSPEVQTTEATLEDVFMVLASQSTPTQ
ncbi:MAG: ABC transporter ATP-binding protein [Anaerolineales bacterium]|nr:ABC transporter ATP-binding protein [Anaerolineales bacterium]